MVWLIGGGLLVALLVSQSITGKYEGREQQVWSWALPTLTPVLSLVLTVLGKDALRPDSLRLHVRTGYYHTASALSYVYLLLVAVPILAEPLTRRDAVELFTVSNLWLGPAQGIVVAALSVVFFAPVPPELQQAAISVSGRAISGKGAGGRKRRSKRDG